MDPTPELGGRRRIYTHSLTAFAVIHYIRLDISLTFHSTQWPALVSFLFPRFCGRGAVFFFLTLFPDKDPARVAAGLKATLHNQNVSEEAKQYAQERLENMGAIGTQHHGKNKAEETFDPQHGSESHIIGMCSSRLTWSLSG